MILILYSIVLKLVVKGLFSFERLNEYFEKSFFI